MQDINLYHLLKFYAKNWIWIVSITGFGLVAGFIYSNFIQVPMYKSEATLLLVRNSSNTDSSTQDTVRINNYIELFKSRRVLDPVISKQNMNISYDNMVGLVDASNSKSTEVIRVAVSSNNAEKSKSFLEAAITSFKDQVEQLYKIDNVKVVDSASLASKPYNINKVLTVLLYSAVSFVSTIIVMFFIYDYRLMNNKYSVGKNNNNNNTEKTNADSTITNFPVKAPAASDTSVASVAPTTPIVVTPSIVESETKTITEAPVITPASSSPPRVRERLFQTSPPRERYGRR